MDLKSILSRAARVGAATMVLAGCLVGTATADGGGEMPSSHPMLLLNTLGSQNWAGWASFGGTFLLPQAGAVSYVKGEWTVPAPGMAEVSELSAGTVQCVRALA